MIVADKIKWVKSIYDGDTLVDITGTDNPFEATVYGNFRNAIETVNKIWVRYSNGSQAWKAMPAGVTNVIVVPFYLKIE